MQIRGDLCAAECQRLREALELPTVDLPFLFVERFGHEAVEQLSRLLDTHLMAESGKRLAGARP